MNHETIFSPCRKYRYTLWRDWSHELKNGVLFTFDPHSDYYPGKPDQYVQFIGLNPSTADEVQDDPTIRRCIGFAKAWGFGALCMTNLFGWRDTDPEKMKKISEPVGAENDKHILEIAKGAGLTVCAWGKDGAHFNRGALVRNMLNRFGIKIYHFGRNGDGTPKHPLYLKSDLQPMEWK